MSRAGSVPTLEAAIALAACGSTTAATSGDGGTRDATKGDAISDVARTDVGAREGGTSDGGDGAPSCSGGMLDPTFGVGGSVLQSVGVNGRAYAIMVQPDGRIIAVGNDDDAQYVAASYHSDGSLDPTFGDGGTVVSTVAMSAYAYGGAVQSNDAPNLRLRPHRYRACAPWRQPAPGLAARRRGGGL